MKVDCQIFRQTIICKKVNDWTIEHIISNQKLSYIGYDGLRVMKMENFIEFDNSFYHQYDAEDSIT